MPFNVLPKRSIETSIHGGSFLRFIALILVSMPSVPSNICIITLSSSISKTWPVRDVPIGVINSTISPNETSAISSTYIKGPDTTFIVL